MEYSRRPRVPIDDRSPGEDAKDRAPFYTVGGRLERPRERRNRNRIETTRCPISPTGGIRASRASRRQEDVRFGWRQLVFGSPGIVPATHRFGRDEYPFVRLCD